MKRVLSLLASLFAIVVMVGCGNSTTNPDDTLQIPTVYDSTNWTANTAEQYLLRSKASVLLTLIKTARKQEVTITNDQLMAIFSTLETYINPADRDRLRGFIQAAATASGHAYAWSSSPSENGNGGVYSGQLFDMYGRDLVEFQEKGLFTNLFYYQALLLMKGTVTPATIDQIVALFGANPTFPNGSVSATQRDVFAAGYAARRDKNDGNGLYTQFKQAALKAKAAAADPSKYGAQLTSALQDMRLIWERSMMATAINYAFTTITTLTASDLDDAKRASGMHTYGECAGITEGWAMVNATDRTMPFATLRQLLALLRIELDATPASYGFWQDTPTTIQSLEQFTKSVQIVYGFTDAEMTDFKSNWVSLQGR